MTKSRLVPALLLALLAACDGSGAGKTAIRADSAGLKNDPNVSKIGPRGVPAHTRDWKTIQASDTLRVLATYNSTTYFLYKGEPLGYEYELLKNLAAAHQLVLQWIVVPKRDSIFAMLESGRGDIAAARIVPLPEDSGKALFSSALYQTDPVLVQRKAPPAVAAAKLPKPADTLLKPGPAENGAPPNSAQALTIQARIVQQPKELAGQKVTLPEKSPYRQTMLELSDATSGDIFVVEVDSSSEALIRRVAQGDVDYTVAEGNLAELQGAYFKNLLVKPVLGAAKSVKWALPRNADELRDSVNTWIADRKTGPLFNTLYKKYFIDRRGYEERVKSRYLSSRTGTLSPYDSLLKAYSPRMGWDWRLLGSQMYQESRFKPNARSWAGATGLLQLMPATARQYGVRNIQNPAQNVDGATRFLVWLNKRWSSNVSDPHERLMFVLASYNAGAGHIEDAQRLTERHGGNPKRWKDVSYWLLQLSKAEFYNDPVVKFGFCRGLEPVTYVSLILDRFDHYRQFVVPADSVVASTWRLPLGL